MSAHSRAAFASTGLWALASLLNGARRDVDPEGPAGMGHTRGLCPRLRGQVKVSGYGQVRIPVEATGVGLMGNIFQVLTAVLEAHLNWSDHRQQRARARRQLGR